MDKLYKKRSGTSGISGHLYETKLIALILFRLLHEADVEEFCLVSNMDEIGAFDDICFKIKIKGRPVAVFIQVKHKENDDKYPTFDNKNESAKWFESLSKVKKKIAASKSQDMFFNGDIIEADCVFILYTNAKCDFDSNTAYTSNYDTILNKLIGTSSTIGTLPLYNEQHVEAFGQIILNEDITVLAEHFANFLTENGNRSMNIMNNEYILQYHVILHQKGIEVSDIQTEGDKPDVRWRTLTFGQDFFETDDKHMVLFRNQLFKEVIKNQPKIRKVSEETGKASHDVEYFLRSLKLKVPIAFGNVDLAISGNAKKIDKRLTHLKTAITDLCKEYEQRETYKIVKIDDTLDSGILSSNGGLASAVGNIFTYDEETMMFKFSNNFTSQQINAKALYLKLEIDNLHEYRFDIKTMKFPKLRFDCTDVAREFLNKLVIFAKQKNHLEVEQILKKNIQDNLNAKEHIFFTSINCDSVFLHYHNAIQKWWMSPKTGMYLTKKSDLDEQAMNDIVVEPQISALQIIFYMSNLKYFRYSFNEDATSWMERPGGPSQMFIVTDTITLTTIKVIQSLRNYYLLNKYVVIDLKLVFDLPTTDFASLSAELKQTDKVLIIVWHDTVNNGIPYMRLCQLAQATQQKQLFVVTNSTLIKAIKDIFTCTDNVIEDQTQNLTAMTPESQKEVIKDTKVTFQNKEVSLDLFIDDASVSFVKGGILDKIIRGQPICIGKSLSNPNYEEIKHLYIKRRVSEVSVTSESTGPGGILVETFLDIEDDAVLMTATPGMGKSTLLTHLSIKTKESDARLWIIRINLLDYSKQFYQWHSTNTDIEISEMLKFLCEVLSKSTDIQIYFQNDEAHLQSCKGDDLDNLELNLFLHSYNKRKLILLFDGFDEICPHYKGTVIKLLNVIRRHPRMYKLWVTSRPYSHILPDLQTVFERCFQLEHIGIAEQESYLDSAWREKMIFEKLSDIKLRKLKLFLTDISRTISVGIYSMYDVHIWMRRVLLHFYKFVNSHIDWDELSTINEATLEMAVRNSPATAGVDTLAGTPLLMYFMADYVVSVLDKYETGGGGEGVYVNLLDVYEIFVENKIKKVLFQDKNKMDLYNPDILLKFEKELAECILLHKKLAAHALLDKDVYSGPNSDEFNDMSPLVVGGGVDLEAALNTLKRGANKTGLISHVTLDDVPVFIHRTFLEYFAGLFICDILTDDKFSFEKKRDWLNAVSLCCDEEVFSWVRFKSHRDAELRNIIKDIDNTESFQLVLIANMAK